MKITYYTAKTLERELLELEDRYGMSSAAFYDAYRARDVPDGITGREAFRWADTYSEVCRLRALRAGQTQPQPA